MFVIFICKRRVKRMIERFLFSRFQGNMFREQDMPLPGLAMAIPVMVSREGGSNARWAPTRRGAKLSPVYTGDKR